MQDILRNIPEEVKTKRAWQFALLLIGYITIFMTLGSGGDVDESMITRINPIVLLAAQGVLAIVMFIGASALFSSLALKVGLHEYFSRPNMQMLGLTVAICFSFMVVNSAIGEWNMQVDFPDSSFEEWAKMSEEQLKVMTEHLTRFQSWQHYALAFIVIGIVPAIGEELLFRGLIQNLLVRAVRNHHVAIWVTGFIFAAIHLQFYGIVPRMLLGVLFGYLYYWSGNLVLAMVGHLVNNGLAITAMYLSQTGVINFTEEQMEQSAPWPSIVLFALASGYLLYHFRKKSTVRHA